MTNLERRGQRLYFILASIIILHQLLNVGLAFSNGFANVNWLKHVIQPVAIAVGVAYLWEGDRWLNWAFSAGFVLHGGVQLFLSGRVLLAFAEKTPPKMAGFFMQMVGIPFGFIALFGLFYVTAGLLFVLSPSIRAFFQYQRQPRIE